MGELWADKRGTPRGQVVAPTGASGICLVALAVILTLAVSAAAAPDRGGPSQSRVWGDPNRPAGPMFAPLHEPGVRDELAGVMSNGHWQEKWAAWEMAAGQGWEPWGQSGDTVYELMAVRGGWVCVLKTQNVTAAIAAAVDLVREVPPWNLTGTGQTVGVWDAGGARRSHRELTGRIGIGDGAMLFSHSTHVTGTICAAGIDARALGMAPAARVLSYDFDDDLAEATLLAMSTAGETGTIQVSNHSYGWVCGWDYSSRIPRWYGTWGTRESDMFGNYDGSARDWDALCYAAPYYLPFKAAGNDRSDEAPKAGARFEYYSAGSPRWQHKQYDSATDPCSDGWDRGGYDTLTPDATAKNVVTIGAAGMTPGTERDLSHVTMTAYSNWGPTDDGRVKPDLVAHGVSLYSTTAESDQSYGINSGTSMSTAVASGTAALLCEFYSRLFPKQFLLSATLKALLIHTADDLGNPGPDYSYGWGLINARAAATHIQDHKDFPNSRRIIEDAVDQSAKTRSYACLWDGSSPIRATLVWTDPPATEVEGLDVAAARLINDLDLRVTGPDGAVYMPFVLNPVHPDYAAGTGDNTRDNVEQVLILQPNTAGRYYAKVMYKGTLIGQKQQFSLLITGQRLTQTAVTSVNADDPTDQLDPNAPDTAG